MNSYLVIGSIDVTAIDAIAPEVVRATLRRIMLETPFQRSPQLRAFLAYIVEASLAGRGSLLKSYSIATEALGRPADFDPATDAIVRVEAKRLRQVLAGIYMRPNCDLPIRIDIPVGRYEPTFRRFQPNVRPSRGSDRLFGNLPSLEGLQLGSFQAKELIRSEERYRALVQASAAVEWRADADGRVTNSTGWTERTGQDAADLKVNGWLQAVHPDDRERAGLLWEQGCRSGDKVEVAYRVLHRDGSYRWMLARGVPIEQADGSISEWIGTIMDIDDHMQTVEALRASEGRFQRVMEAARLIAWELDPVTKFVTRSSNSRSIFGIGSGDLSDFVSLVHQDDRARVIAALNEAIERDQPFEESFRVLRSDGSLIHVMARGGMLRAKAPREDRFIGVTCEFPLRDAA
jgi:PAS domain S-box-containing protein